MKRNIKKGGNVTLAESDIEGMELLIGVDFSFDSGSNHEVDASVFLLGENKRIRSDADFIFYNQRSDSRGGFIRFLEEVSPHASDKHQFSIDLERVPNSVHSIVFCLTIHDAEQRNQNFSMVDDICLRVLKRSTGEELIRFSDDDKFTTETALRFCEIYRRGEVWKFRGVGQGYAGGLDAMARNFGVNLEVPHVDVVDVVDVSISTKGLPTMPPTISP